MIELKPLTEDAAIGTKVVAHYHGSHVMCITRTESGVLPAAQPIIGRPFFVWLEGFENTHISQAFPIDHVFFLPEELPQ